MDDKRAEIIRRVGRAMLLPTEQNALKVKRTDGVRPVVVALDDDRVADVLEQVRNAGGAANVVMADGPGLVVLQMRQTATGPSDDDVAIHPDTRMDMLLSLMQQAHHVTTYIVEPDAALTVEEPHLLLTLA